MKQAEHLYYRVIMTMTLLQMLMTAIFAAKSWQYFHFNGNATGTDSRIKYSNDMMTNALSSYKVHKSKGLMYLGYGLHAIQDIEAHGQIGRGANVPAHGLTADNPNYE